MTIGKGSTAFKYVKIVFGIFMLVVYFGMAALMLLNFFQWNDSFDWFRYLLAAVFAVYAVYRCYRQITGKDYYLLSTQNDKTDSDETTK